MTAKQCAVIKHVIRLLKSVCEQLEKLLKCDQG